MLAAERQQLIYKQVCDHGIVYVNELVKELDVSAPTVRNDLDKLVKKNHFISRIHGGITLNNTQAPNDYSGHITSYNERRITSRKEKKEIANKAVELINEGETLMLDSSSTCLELANALKKQKKITVITNGLATASVLNRNPAVTTVVIGGVLKTDSNTIVYDELENTFLKYSNIDKYFFSASGLSLEAGFSEYDFLEVKHKRANVLAAKQSIALIDSSKFDKDSSSTFCNLSEVDYLVTDSSLAPDTKLQYQKKITIL